MTDNRIPCFINIKEGAHLSKKVNEDGTRSAIQFDENNKLCGPVNLEIVDCFDNKTVEYDEEDISFGEKLKEEVVIPTLQYALQELVNCGVDVFFEKGVPYVKEKGIPFIKEKGNILLNRIMGFFGKIEKKQKIKKKSVSNMDTATIVEMTIYESKEKPKNECSYEEMEKKILDLEFVICILVTRLNELSNIVVVDDNPEIEVEAKMILDNLSSENVLKCMESLLKDENKNYLDESTRNLLKAYINGELIIDSRNVPINNVFKNSYITPKAICGSGI